MASKKAGERTDGLTEQGLVSRKFSPFRRSLEVQG